MTTFINVVLLVTSTVLPIVTIFGDNWKKLPGKRRKLTPHGYATFALMAVALAAGIAKVVDTRISDKKHEDETASARTEAHAAYAQIEASAKKADQKLDEQKAQLIRTQFALARANGGLDETHKEIGRLHTDLNGARDDAKRQSNAAMITALANSDQQVKEIDFDLPFTRLARRPSTLADAFLPPFRNSACAGTISVDVVITIGSERYQLQFKEGDSESKNFPFLVPARVADVAVIPQSDYTGYSNLEAFTASLSQRSWNGALFHSEVSPAGTARSASNVLSVLNDTQKAPVLISSNYTDWALHADLAKNLPLHKACVSELLSYIEKATDRGALILRLDQKQGEMIVVPLKRGKPSDVGPFGDRGFYFGVAGAPAVVAFPMGSVLFPGETAK